MRERIYAAIDLKSFYASVECVERGLDPLDAHLVVADESRTERTICLAVSPALKAYGVPGRARLFEVKEQLRLINAARRAHAPGRQLGETAHLESVLRGNPSLALDCLVAPPRMALYMEYSARICQIYLRYVAEEDIHVYSIDEAFLDITAYLSASGLTPRRFVQQILRDIFLSTGITATAGIGPNLYLCKVAMDVQAKRIEPDEHGARIACLNEIEYRRQLWSHRPLTDFWRVGRGIARRLESLGLYTMGDVARQSVRDEEVLYRLLGVNAELLIDHAWGWEPCTIADIKAYRPKTRSVSSGQVLPSPYPFGKARLVAREMADALALTLAQRGEAAVSLALLVGYERLEAGTGYAGEVYADHYGRTAPRPVHAADRFEPPTFSARRIAERATALYDQIVDPRLAVRRLILSAETQPQQETPADAPEQLDLFTDYEARARRQEEEARVRAQERRRQQAVLDIRAKYGANALFRGMDLMDGATARARNQQIGGHRA